MHDMVKLKKIAYFSAWSQDKLLKCYLPGQKSTAQGSEGGGGGGGRCLMLGLSI